MKSLIVVFLISCSSLVFASKNSDSTLPRPPQYILISFDGSYNADMWKATREQALSSQARVTHFISGVDFLMGSDRRKIPDATDSIYTPPRWKSGRRSDIGFGGDREQMQARIIQMKQNMDAGMEIGGHANAHFDGTKWSEGEWIYEFNLFFKFVTEAFSINRIDQNLVQVDENDWKHSLTDQLRSFRAPYLGRGDGLWDALGNTSWGYDNQSFKKNFLYDASDVARSPTDWPEKSRHGDYWLFRMAVIPVPGLKKPVLSMDYNFYVVQSNAKDNSKNANIYEKQMFEAYLNWFQRNYYGNRAPLNIGHHFSTWNQGAYWKALKRFMNTVCHLPEVQCVSGAELAPVLDSYGSELLANYKKGNFTRDGIAKLNLPQPMNVSSVHVSRYNFVRAGIADLPKSQTGETYSWLIRDEKNNQTINLRRLAQKGVSRLDLIRTERDGTEKKVPMLIDWNPMTGESHLTPWTQGVVIPCDAKAHEEKVDTRWLMEESQ